MVNIRLRSFIFILSVAWVLSATAQDQGEIEDTQVIIEKDKPLTLPKANRLYKPTEISINQYQPAPVEYSFSTIDIQSTEYSPGLGSKQYKPKGEIQQNDNYLKLGYGNYQSPLVEENYTMRLEEHFFNAFVFHESFGKGPVRDKQSAFSDTQIKLKGHLHGDFNVDPYINYSRSSYYFYGRDTTFDFANPLIIDEKVALQNIALGVVFRQGMESKLDYSLRPHYRNTVNKITGDNKIAVESELFVEGMASYEVIENLNIGADLKLATTRYESSFLQRRNYISFNPKAIYAFDKGSFGAGFTIATANDTTSESSSLFFFPDIDFQLNLSPDLALYGKAGGGLGMVGLYSLSNENRYLEDDLMLLNQSNKVDLEGGFKSRILNQLVLQGSLGYSLIENLPFFMHNPADSSRFMVVYDSGSLVRTTLGIDAAYFLSNKFSVNYSMEYYGYSLNKLEEPWYKPSSKMDVLVRYMVQDDFRINLNMLFLSGIKAPSPTDESVINLSSIVDLGLSVDYAINDQISIFGQTRNMVGGNYERYLNYPVRGFSFKLGGVYMF